MTNAKRRPADTELDGQQQVSELRAGDLRRFAREAKQRSQVREAQDSTAARRDGSLQPLLHVIGANSSLTPRRGFARSRSGEKPERSHRAKQALSSQQMRVVPHAV